MTPALVLLAFAVVFGKCFDFVHEFGRWPR